MVSVAFQVDRTKRRLESIGLLAQLGADVRDERLARRRQPTGTACHCIGKQVAQIVRRRTAFTSSSLLYLAVNLVRNPKGCLTARHSNVLTMKPASAMSATHHSHRTVHRFN